VTRNASEVEVAAEKLAKGSTSSRPDSRNPPVGGTVNASIGLPFFPVIGVGLDLMGKPESANVS